jgi:cell division protein FtsB
MGYKVQISVLEGLKKTLENNNKLLKGLQATPKSDKLSKQIKANEKQIKLLEDEYYIGKKSDNV